MVSNFLIVWFLGAKNGRMHQQKYFWIANIYPQIHVISMNSAKILQLKKPNCDESSVEAQVHYSRVLLRTSPASHVSGVPCPVRGCSYEPLLTHCRHKWSHTRLINIIFSSRQYQRHRDKSWRWSSPGPHWAGTKGEGPNRSFSVIEKSSWTFV